jgi:mono/diheme cytochrome c family protein
MQPADNTISRGWLPYEFANDLEGKDLAKLQPSPLDSINSEANLATGKELYDIYCALCHGAKGDGQGTLVKREKILGVPSYADAARDISVGSTYHTIYYGLNSMGSYAGQINYKERWQVAEYVMQLKQDLTK